MEFRRLEGFDCPVFSFLFHYQVLPAPFCLGGPVRGFGVLSLCGLCERSSFLPSAISPFSLRVCPN